jgi:hypothetical protein
VIVRSRALVAGAVLACVLAACAPAASTEMQLENLTDVPVAVHVDGTWVGTYPADTSRSVPVPGPAPHLVEIFTGSGARLVEWGFGDADVAGGGVSTTEVPCGVIRLSVGRIELPAMDASAPRIGTCP